MSFRISPECNALLPHRNKHSSGRLEVEQPCIAERQSGNNNVDNYDDFNMPEATRTQ